MSTVAINWDLRIYVDEHGDVFPIVNFIDADGDECAGPEDAVMCVAGSEDTWYTIDLRKWVDAPSAEQIQ